MQVQPLLGRPWPTVVFEAGISQSVTDIIDVRDNVLGYITGINIFFGVKYNENSAPGLDSLWAVLAVRDINAPLAPANAGPKYPPCIVVRELPKVNGRYHRLDDPLPGNHKWSVATSLLFYPDPIPVLVPPLPPTLDIDLEAYRIDRHFYVPGNDAWKARFESTE
jgi:hypothetical protein